MSAVLATSVLLEREAEATQQGPALVVAGGGGHDRDVHPSDPVDLVWVDLQEDRLFGQPEGVVTVAVELLGRQSAEVPDTRQRQGEQPVEELPHPVPPQGDRGADCLPLAQFELRDGLAGAVHPGLLAGDQGQVADRALDHLGVPCGIAHAGVHHDLDQSGHLVDVAVAELGPQLREDLLAVLGLQPRHDARLGVGAGAHEMSLPERLASRTRVVRVRPSRATSSVREPSRVPFLVYGSTSITLRTWLGASTVSIPPAGAPPCPAWVTLAWRCTRWTPSTITRSRSVCTSRTRPVWPLSRPEMTTTRSPFLIFAMVTAPPVRARRCA